MQEMNTEPYTARTSLPVGQRRPAPPPRPKTAPVGHKNGKRKKLTAKLDASRVLGPTPDHAQRPGSSASFKPPKAESQDGEVEEKDEEEEEDEEEHGSAPPSRRGSRPPSVVSEAQSIQSSVRSSQSEFFGGRRMEGLLQALRSEGPSGHFFRRFIAQSMNKLWMDCLAFWTDLQHYHQLFYQESMNLFMTSKKAEYLYSQFIVPHAAAFIRCELNTCRQILAQLKPPFEELFDNAEEHVIQALYDPWLRMSDIEQHSCKRIQLIEEKRRIQSKSKIVVRLQRRGLIRESVEPDDDPMEGYADPVYDPSLLAKIPEEHRAVTLDRLVHNRIELEHFKNFLQENFAGLDLMCWMDIEAWKRIPHADEKRRNMKGADIRTKYLTKKYFFGPNSPAGREGQNTVMELGGGWGKLLEEVPPTPVLTEMQKYVGARLEQKWLPLFLATPEFASRQKPVQHMEDAAEDLVAQRKRRQQLAWKMLENKWASSSKEVMAFRRALLNPVTGAQFRKYVSVKGDSYENDYLFWQEVQKYKGLCHANADETMVHQKIMAIINCFIDSSIPPSLQIDVPPEQAEKILERRRELGPYIFREAQLTVFRVLLPHWQDFCDFRANTADDKVLSTLERQRRRAKAQDKMRMRQQQEKQEQQAARRRALGLPDDADLDAYHDPFARGDSPDEDDVASQLHADGNAITWSYSEYMKSMDQENVLNNTDPSTFSSVLDPDSRPSSRRNLPDSSILDLAGGADSPEDPEGKTKKKKGEGQKAKANTNNSNSHPRRKSSRGGSIPCSGSKPAPRAPKK